MKQIKVKINFDMFESVDILNEKNISTKRIFPQKRGQSLDQTLRQVGIDVISTLYLWGNTQCEVYQCLVEQ